MSFARVQKTSTIFSDWLKPRRGGSVKRTPMFPHSIGEDGEDEDQQRRSTDGPLDWKRAAPRWFLLLVLAVLLVAVGWSFSEIRGATSRDQARLEAAIADAPSKYQARLSERVAVVEAQAQQLSQAIGQLTVQMEKQNSTMADLTVQLRVLNAEIKARR